MIHNDERKEYTLFTNLEPSAQEDIKNLEKKLTYKDFLNGKIISISDVETYDNFILLNVNLSKEEYPNINKWKKEIERMKLNWKISKKPIQIKGRTFNEYVKFQYKKLEEQDKNFSNKIKQLTNISKNIINDNSNKNKEIATLHFFKKKDEGYKIRILIKFLPGLNIKYQDIASKIMIISHNYFKNKTICEEGKGDLNNGISAILSSIIDKSEYDIENFANDIKRNIQGILTLTILGIDKIEESNDKNKEKENEDNFKNDVVNLEKDIQIKNDNDNK